MVGKPSAQASDFDTSAPPHSTHTAESKSPNMADKMEGVVMSSGVPQIDVSKYPVPVET